MNTVLKKFKNVEKNKAVKDTDVSVKIFKCNAELFAEKIYLHFKNDLRFL